MAQASLSTSLSRVCCRLERGAGRGRWAKLSEMNIPTASYPNRRAVRINPAIDQSAQSFRGTLVRMKMTRRPDGPQVAPISLSRTR
jgi:hypothetical protein